MERDRALEESERETEKKYVWRVEHTIALVVEDDAAIALVQAWVSGCQSSCRQNSVWTCRPHRRTGPLSSSAPLGRRADTRTSVATQART
eukprot:3338634-Prymnesium_polylepis.2